MNRHHPNLVAGQLHVALHLGLRVAQPGHEALQRWRFAALVVERKIEEFVERVGRFVTEPRKDFTAKAARAEKSRIERKRRFAACRMTDAFQLLGDVGPLRAERGEQAAPSGSRRA